MINIVSIYFISLFFFFLKEYFSAFFTCKGRIPSKKKSRQKLATLPITRFQDLASDVYFELARRYSNIVDNEVNKLVEKKMIKLSN
jgi:hypothetical protein